MPPTGMHRINRSNSPGSPTAGWVLLVALVLTLAILPEILVPGQAPQPPGPAHQWSQTPGDGLPPRAPNPHFFAERAYPYGEIPLERWHEAQLQARTLRDAAATRSGTWIPRGPTNIGGRLTDIAVDPTDENTVYAGAAEGGVLRSRDGGQTWTPLFDTQSTLSIGALAIDPTDPNLVYAGTGEVNPGGGSVAYGGAGVFRSADQGDTWESIGLENTGSIGRIRVDPSNSDRIFVAAMGHLWSNGPDRGLYRTTDGGTNWERILFVSDSTGCVDIIQRPDQPDVLFAAMWERIRKPEYYRYGGITCGVYRTTDGGDTWDLVGGGLPPPSTLLGRIGLSLCASQPNIMDAIYATRIGYFDGLYRSTDGGATWNRTSDTSLANVFSSYGWWFGNVRTHPVDPQKIYVLGLPFYRSTNGGASYSDASGIMHVDHHALDFGPGDNPVLYNGNDGGVYRSTNGGSIWSKSYDLPITQIYRIGLDASNPSALYLGSQDNGTCRTLSGALDDWSMIFGGDGFQPLVHPLNSNRIWAQYQYGGLYYTSNGGSNWSYALNGVGGRFNWNAPHVRDPNDPDLRYFGSSYLYVSSSNTSWTQISGDLTGGSHLGYSGQVNGTLTTIASSPLDIAVIWTGSDDGYVHVTTDGGTEWTNVSAGLPERWITSVRTDPFSRETAYVTLSGFRWAEPLAHVYRTTDLGSTWEPIAGNLPDAPANDFAIDPTMSGRYFVATDVGVFQSVNGGAQWGMMGSNLPNVVVTSLALDPQERVLFAGTYGRSFFAYELEDAASVGEDLAATPITAGRVLPPHPNPTRDGTWASWETTGPAPATIEILSVSGRRIWSAEEPAGSGRLWWNGQDAAGHEVPSGAYFVRVLVDGASLGGTSILVRR